MTSATVVVCTYTQSRRADLDAALASLHAQTHAPTGIVVVVDHAADYARTLRAELDGVQVVENAGSQGLSGARNTGIAAATGDVVAFLDDDAVAEPEWLGHLLGPYGDASVIGVGGRVEPRWDAGRPPWFPEEYDWVVGCTYRGHRVDVGPVRNPIGANMSFRRHVLADVVFDEHLGRVGSRPTGCEETELAMQATRRHGGVVWYEPAAVVHHRVPPDRGSWRYFHHRCWAEGASKRQTAALVRSPRALAPERSQVASVLPRAVASALAQRRLPEAAALVTGLAAAAAGYALSRPGTAKDAAGPRTGVANPPATVPVTVVVATRDRTEMLRDCIEALLRQDHRNFELLVVDNDPSTDATERLVHGWPDARVRYLRHDRRGLARAHNRALDELTTPVVAFTDDDVIAEPDWLRHMVAPFADPGVACVTGRIVALELETQAQRWFDQYAGFSKGDERRVFGPGQPGDVLYPYTAGAFGSGANMAFRTDVLRAMGGFDPALGAGTPARGGDDLAAFFEVVAAGHRLVYEPGAIVRHRHPRADDVLRRQVYGYGAGLTAYLTSVLVRRPARLVDLSPRLLTGVRYVFSPTSPKNARLRGNYPSALRWRERAGMAVGPVGYARSRWGAP